jgi:hypothetical protein
MVAIHRRLQGESVPGRGLLRTRRGRLAGVGELDEAIRAIRADLDAFDVRLAELERAPLMAFRMAEATAQRRKIVARMRKSGLSVERIAQATGAGRSTVLRDLAAVEAITPQQVVGVNGKTWHRRNVGR